MKTELSPNFANLKPDFDPKSLPDLQLWSLRCLLDNYNKLTFEFNIIHNLRSSGHYSKKIFAIRS